MYEELIDKHITMKFDDCGQVRAFFGILRGVDTEVIALEYEHGGNMSYYNRKYIMRMYEDEPR